MNLEKILKALADGNRLRIMNLLFKRELCVCEIEEILGLSQTNVSRHLNRLSQTGLLDSRKEAQWVYYSINGDFKREHSALVRYLETSFRKNKTCCLDLSNLLKTAKESTSGISLRCGKM